MRYLLILMALSCALGSVGQDLSNLRSRKVLLVQDSLQLDTLSIVPSSMRISSNGSVLDSSAFQLNPLSGTLFRTANTPLDTLVITYRVFPINFTRSYANKSMELINSEESAQTDPFKYTAKNEVEDLFELQGLNKSGSISRGVLVGNNQDLSVNSSLSLQLSGKLTDNISVLASITDDNIPIQASGNTAQLQDFDQVFIKVFDDKNELTVGDLQLHSNKSYFMKYFKKLLGASVKSEFNMGPERSGPFGDFTRTMTAQASGAISKGKFARNQIQGQEGVQGPYRLFGGENETFIIILSGTERVYIDGQLLDRGQENDYVIDYNSAELTFTSNRLITKDRRIVVEFQYSDKNYTRSIIQAFDEYKSGRTTLRVNFYSEQDHKNSSLQQDLDPDQKSILADVGDSLQNAFVPGVDTVDFSENLVLYAEMDSLGYSPVYVHNNSPDSAFYQLSFSNVGAGNGFYIQDDFTANGRVFRWVAPDTINGNIILKGDHEPVRLLVSPKSQQMLTIGVDHKFREQTTLTAEGAWSSYDLNTFSTKDKNDDQGVALTLGFEDKSPIQRGKDDPWKLRSEVFSEFISKNFKPVERFRSVEFERDWNILGKTIKEDQLIATGGIGLVRNKNGSMGYTFNTFQARDVYTGYKHGLNTDLKIGSLDVQFDGSYLTTTGINETDFIRHRGKVVKHFKWFNIGYKDEHERNVFKYPSSDSTLLNSYQFYDWEVFISSPDTFKNKFQIYYRERHDKGVKNNELSPKTFARQYGARFDLLRNPRNRLRANVGYRELFIKDSTLTNESQEQTLVTRLEYDLSMAKGAIVFSLFYEFGSGLEPKKEFVYIEVPAGQGVYVWIDYNDNGIRELNEFEIAQFAYEANFIRVFTPTTEYINTFSNQFSSSVDLRPQAVWNSKTGFLKFVSKFSDQAAYRIDRKTNNEEALEAINPFRQQVADSSLLALNSSVRNTVYFNRTHQVYGLDYTFQDVGNKSLLSSGFESRSKTSHDYGIRWNITRKITLNINNIHGRSASNSDFLEGRTYNIAEFTTKPKFTYQPNTSIRASISAAFTNKQNAKELGDETAEISDLGVEFRWNAVGKGSLLANFNFIDIGYDGSNNSSLANDMLNGLNTGQNLTWGLGIQRTISQNLQLDLTYNGRKSEDVNAVHTGGVQIRAFF